MADEYIRKADAVDAINANADDLEQNGGIPYAQGARAMAIVVEKIPPADVVQVVRCRDCKYMVFTPKAPNKVRPGETHPDFYHCYKYRQFHPLIKPDSDFCSYGERERSEHG